MTSPYHYTTNALVRRPKADPPVVNAILKIFQCFSLSTWGVILLEVIVVTIFLFITEVCSSPIRGHDCDCHSHDLRTYSPSQCRHEGGG